MSAGKKTMSYMAVFLILAIVALALFSACDNRKAINPISQQEQSVYLNFNPPKLYIYSVETPDTVDLNVWVRGPNGGGIDSAEVEIVRSPEIGTIIQPDLTVDGYAQGKFIIDPGVNYDDTLTFVASTTKASYTAKLEVLYSSHTVSMTFNPPILTVHSTNNPDTVEINIWVRDDDGGGVDSVNVFVARENGSGSIIPAEATNNGYTQALYITDPGNITDSLIVIRAQTGSAIDRDTLRIDLEVQGEIADMNISLQKTRLIANGTETSNIYVSVVDTTGVPIADGTVVFMENYGASNSGILSAGSVPTANGIAQFTLTAPASLDPELITEIDTLHAYAYSLSGDTTDAYSMITYIPGIATDLNIITIPDSMTAGSANFDTIKVEVTDNNGNFVEDGTQVQFKHDILESDLTSLTTTINGHAYGIYTVGTESGTDLITAFIKRPESDTIWSNTVPLEIRSAAPTNVRLTTSDANIEVGGIATQIYATMQDENENPLSSGYGVRFEITSAPAMDTSGPSFAHVPFDSVTHVYETETNVNGRAAVALFSGTRSGTVRIKATSTDDENIFKEKPLVTIQSGPPAVISIAPSNIATPNGQALVTGVTAMVWDQFTNPVEPLTAVHFTIQPDSVAEIEGAALTGGWVDEDGDTIGVKGLAHTWMAYSCIHTFDTVRVIASSGDMADTSGAIVLALYEGAIDMWANPGVCYCTSPTNWQYSEITAQLLDGLGCAIKNGVIVFTAQVCGNLDGPTIDTTDINGYATTTFEIRGDQIPAQPPPLPPACTAKVKGKLQGYPDVEGETDIYCQLIQ